MTMQTQKGTTAAPKPIQNVEEKLQKLREIYAGAPELGRVALERMMPELETAVRLAPKATTAGRIGIRQGKVSEFLLIFKLRPGGADRLRALLGVLGGNFQGADAVGTVHDMRFVLLDNDTKLLFATAFDGDWDPYIADFSTKIPDPLDVLFCDCEGYPGMHSPKVGEYLLSHQVQADGWYVANPNLTVAETRRLEKIGKAVDEFLDKVG
ncbi:MAG TPA: hypothetical protein VKG01_15050 [Thermoanaerobaculia bacterium]|nr:hypothetical protein [Thermoanaerobaculia bacterium]